MQAIKEATLIWLQWEYLQGASELEKEDFKLQLIEDNKDLIYPEPLHHYRRFKKYGIPTFSGGLYNQPHIQMMEFDAVQAAIDENDRIQLFKQMAKRNSSPKG